MTGWILRVLLVLGLGALAGAAALEFSNSQPKEYESHMKFGYGRLVSPEIQLLGPGFSEPQVDEHIRIQTEAAEVDSFDVAVATEKAHPELRMSAGEIAGRVTVAGVRDTLTVALSARAGEPNLAARLAAAYGEQYLKLRRRTERARTIKVRDALRAELAVITQGEKQGVRGANLRSQINALQVIRRIGSGSPKVIENPRASTVPFTPKTDRNVLFGVLFGLVVGIGMVALRSESRSRAAVARARRAVKSRGEPVP